MKSIYSLHWTTSHLLSKYCWIWVQVLHNSVTEIKAILQSPKHECYWTGGTCVPSPGTCCNAYLHWLFTFASQHSWFYAFSPSFLFLWGIPASFKLVCGVWCHRWHQWAIRNRGDSLHRQCFDKFRFSVQPSQAAHIAQKGTVPAMVGCRFIN